MNLSEQQSSQNSDHTRPDGAAVSIHHVVTQSASESEQVPAQQTAEQEPSAPEPEVFAEEAAQPEDMFGDDKV
ncbi:MAG: hypothetical protein ACPGO5_00265 [Patescibacteria group bacterium]